MGEHVKIRDKRYEVVGILDKTLTAPDNAVFMTLEDAQKIVHDDLPDALKNTVEPGDDRLELRRVPRAGRAPGGRRRGASSARSTDVDA